MGDDEGTGGLAVPTAGCEMAIDDAGDRVRGSTRGTDRPEWVDTQDLLREGRRQTNRFGGIAAGALLLVIAVVVVMAWLDRNRDGDETAAGSDDQSGELRSSADDAAGADGAGDGADDPDGAGAGDGDDGGSTEADGSADPATADGAGGDGAAAGGGATGGDGEEGDRSAQVMTVLPTPPSDGPYVDATLTDNVFVLSGVVPSEDLKVALEAQAELAYAPFATSELVVDESVPSADWLAAAPAVVGLLPMITDGTIRMQDGQVTLAGRSPQAEYATRFEQTVGQLTGLPVSATAIEVTDLAPPRFVATVEDGAVTLVGELPSETLLQTFVQGAAAVYGADNVTSTMTVDEGTYTSFWNYTMPGVFQLFAPFPSYRIQVQDGVTSGSMQGGVLFGVDSAAITPEAAEVLGIGAALLARDRSLEMTVIGHTDDWGPEESNRRLSLARAQSVIDFIAAAGIDPTRLTADGRGETEPLAPNDTAEGRALNRRVEFVFD